MSGHLDKALALENGYRKLGGVGLANVGTAKVQEGGRNRGAPGRLTSSYVKD